MDSDFRIFLATHIVDIILVIIFGAKVLFISKADLRTKFIGAVLLFAVITLGRLLGTQLAVGGNPYTVWSFAIAIGIRLIALKIIFTVIDAEP